MATPRQKQLTLVACILGSATVFIDGTIVNVALPAIRSDLNGGLAVQQWVVEAYLLTLGSLILLGGSLSDHLGRRRVFRFGTAAFGATSLLCAVAPSTGVLIAARALQGVAGAILVPGTLALIMSVFDESERGAAIGRWTAWTGVATVIGPLAGGVLIGIASWRWVFAVSLVPVAATLMLIPRAVPASMDEPAEAGPLDLFGALLCSLGLAGLVFGLIEQPNRGWGDPVVFVPLLASAVLLPAFLLHERRTASPMVPLVMFRIRNFAVGNVATFSTYAGLGVVTFLLVLFLQQISGYSALEAGLTLLPVTVIMFLLSRRFGALADRIGPRPLMGAGPIIAGAGVLWLTMLDADSTYLGGVLPGMVVFGLGLSMTVAPLTATVLAAGEEHAGVASGVNNAVARVAGLIAIAVIGAAVAGQFAAQLDDAQAKRSLAPAVSTVLDDARNRPLTDSVPSGLPPAQAQEAHGILRSSSVSAFRVGMGIAAFLTALGGVVSAIGIRTPRRAVAAADCPGGAICGASEQVGREPAPARRAQPEPVPAG
jgi:EmrB/QacA subfamily drug resistance transporter